MQRHMLIAGKVQGIFYRAFIKEQAEKLNLSGWVKNLPTGEVEIVLEGSQEDIKKMTKICKTGHPQARVDKMTKEDKNKKECTSFVTF
jgi:acylphosphatase